MGADAAGIAFKKVEGTSIHYVYPGDQNQAYRIQQFIDKHRNHGIIQQSIESQLPVNFAWPLGNKANEKSNVVDMCAAPGSKLAQLIHKESEKNSVIIANDITAKRLDAIPVRFSHSES